MPCILKTFLMVAYVHIEYIHPGPYDTEKSVVLKGLIQSLYELINTFFAL